MSLATKRYVDRMIGLRGLEHPRRLQWPSGADMDYSDFSFGFSISGVVVTLNAGYIWDSMYNGFAVAQTTKTITADHQYLWVIYNMRTAARSWSEPSLTLPQSTATLEYTLFYEFRLINGVASIAEGGIHHVGDIHLPGEMVSTI